MSPAHNSCYCPSTRAVSRYDMFTTWEERAFAEDSCGDLGSIWPPRSYSCSFCGREFRSAQALGGHMNVHRRDRARLKLSQSSHSDEEEVVQTPTDRHEKETSVPSSLMISRADSEHGGGVPRVLSGSLSLPMKRSAVSGSDDRMLPSSPYRSPLVRKQEESKGSGFLGTRPVVYPTIVEAMKNITDPDCSEKPLSIKDTRIFSHQLEAPSDWCIDKASQYKRAKISDSCKLPRFLFDQIFRDDYSGKLEVTRVKVENREEIDLELRLGNPPEVK